MSRYKIDRCPEHINTVRMTRVCENGLLVATFINYADAVAWVAGKESAAALVRAKASAKPRSSWSECESGCQLPKGHSGRCGCDPAYPPDER